ncbi:MAG: response regulator [Nitrospirae bacterium]|nr:MAG: response regulator [Nitrospirota bacterium]
MRLRTWQIRTLASLIRDTPYLSFHRFLHPRNVASVLSMTLDHLTREQALEVLVRDVRAFIGERDLPRLLGLIIESARRLTSARYAAVGLVDEAEKQIGTFIASGLDEATQVAIGHPPTGNGLLGAIPSDGSPLRLHELTRHPSFRGFPSAHPPMRSFLGIALHAHDRVFGRLYLADKQGSDGMIIDFTQLDEAIITLLAAHAGAAIENCLLLQSIHRQTREYQQTLASLPVSVVQMTRELVIRSVNHTFCHLLQARDSDLIGRHLGEVLPVKDLLAFLAPFQSQPRSVATVELEWWVPRRDSDGADERLLSCSATSVEDQDTRQIVLVIQDRTEFRNLENQARQSQKLEMIGTLAGGIAHDFNNILTIISGYSQMASMKVPPRDPVYHDLERIIQATDRASALTQQLLAFCRAQVMQRKALNINQVIEQLSHMLNRIIGEDIEYAVELEPAVNSITADPVQIEQVVLNLVINARQAMPYGGRLMLRTRNIQIPQPLYARGEHIPAGDYVQVDIADTGSGMSEETMDRIFEPFFTTKEPGEGTGLGLSTVYGIVKQSQGFIVVSSALGRGSTFTMYFPAIRRQPDRQSPPPMPASVKPGTATILLVEDEYGIRVLLADVLAFHGYTVLQAASSSEALAISERHRDPIDLLVTDVIMPGLSGWQLAEYFLARYPASKVLLMSGYPAERASRLAQEQCSAGSHSTTNLSLDNLSPQVAYIQKPFSPQALLHQIQRLLSET